MRFCASRLEAREYSLDAVLFCCFVFATGILCAANMPRRFRDEYPDPPIQAVLAEPEPPPPGSSKDGPEGTDTGEDGSPPAYVDIAEPPTAP